MFSPIAANAPPHFISGELTMLGALTFDGIGGVLVSPSNQLTVASSDNARGYQACRADLDPSSRFQPATAPGLFQLDLVFNRVGNCLLSPTSAKLVNIIFFAQFHADGKDGNLQSPLFTPFTLAQSPDAVQSLTLRGTLSSRWSNFAPKR